MKIKLKSDRILRIKGAKMFKVKRFIRRHLDIYFILVGSFMFASMGFFARLISDELSSIEIMFFRNFIGVVFIIYQISKIKHKKVGGHFWLLLFRGFVGTISLYAFFYNISNISLNGAFAFQKTNPIFVALIAMIFLKEKLSFFAVCGILLSFVGVLFIIDPFSFSGFDLKNSFLGIMSGLCAAIALTSVRQLGHYYNTEYIVLSFFALGALLPVISMVCGEFLDDEVIKSFDFAVSKFVMPSGITWLWIILMSYLSILYQIYVTRAYRATKKAGIVAGVSYMDVPFTLFLGLLLGDGFPSFIVFCGIAMVVCGGLIVSMMKK